MGTPRAVKKQANKATKLQTDLVDSRKKADDTVPPVDDSIPAPATVNKAPEPGKEPVKPGVDPAPAEPEDDWKKRFIGMKGAYDKLVIESTGNKEKLLVQESELGDLRGQITSLREEVKNIQDPPPPKEEVIELTPEELDEYGQPLIDLISKVAKGSGDSSKDLAKQVLDLEKRLNSLEQGQEAIVQTTVVNSKQTFETRLTEIVPDWRQINDDASFMEWLSQEVPYTGKERQVFLQEAHEKLDVNKVAKFFTDWKEQNGAPTPLPVEEEVVPTIQPSNSPSAAVVVDTEAVRGKLWSKAEIDKFYSDKRRGKYNGSQELLKEARSIEKDILAAPRENRITR